MVAPAAATASATANSWSRDSTAHGPATAAKWPPPTLAEATSTTVSSGWKSRLTNLNGLRTGTALSTPGSASQGNSPINSRSPTAPMTVRCFPSETCASAPISPSLVTTLAMSSGVASLRMTMITTGS